jgi:hypothetical protein
MNADIISIGLWVALLAITITLAVFTDLSLTERCEDAGGQIISLNRGYLCVRDGLIVEDY